MLIGYTTSTSFFTFFAAARTFRMSSSVLSRPAVKKRADGDGAHAGWCRRWAGSRRTRPSWPPAGWSRRG